MSKLTDNIKTFRLLSGMTQRQLAQILECSPSTLCNWENGNACPPGDSIYKLCEVFKTNPNTLFGFEPIEELEKLEIDRETSTKQLEEIKKQMVELENRIQSYSKLLNR